MRRRALLRALAALGPASAAGLARPKLVFAEPSAGGPVSVDTSPLLRGKLT